MQRRQEAGRIVARLRSILPAILVHYPVDAAHVYSSVARETVTPFSDADMALLMTDTLSPYQQLNLELTIQQDIQAALQQIVVYFFGRLDYRSLVHL